MCVCVCVCVCVAGIVPDASFEGLPGISRAQLTPSKETVGNVQSKNDLPA